MKDLKPVLVKIEEKKHFKRLLSGVPQTKGMKSGYLVLKPGESVGEHNTESREEVIIVLAGRADVYCQGRKVFSAREGNLIYIPPETAHNIKNTGKDILRYVYVVSSINTCRGFSLRV